MHSYIYQIFEDQPRENAWVTSDFLLQHPESLPVANAVDDVADRAGVIGHFGSWLEKNRLGTMFSDSFALAPEAAEFYFEGRFAAFQQAMSALQTLNEGQFIHEHRQIQNLIDDLGQIFSNKYGVYVLLNGSETALPLDEFVRNAKPGTPYYFGGVLDYRF